MTGEELDALIKAEIGENERLHAILDRIRDGKANLTDSELYAAITARITAQQMRRNVLSLDKREAAFVGITRERYTDTFTVFSAVQRILDAENGIHIRPKEPGFDTGRARKIGHSLEDRTVPDSTIERRARSATENFCMSHHDDCMRVNAEFRARAGLQSYAIRDGSAKCCDWCADVSGKYPANETPAGFWGRHDNCKCSILYESKRGGRQLLSGTSKKWEVVPENAGAEPLVRLTHEQVMQIRQEKQLTVLTPGEVVNNPLRILTKGAENGKIISEGMFRQTANTGAFSHLPERMSKKHIREIAEKYGIDMSGITLKIEKNEELLRIRYAGIAAPEQIGLIIFLPNAFKSEEELARTLFHERVHVMQFKKHGSEYVQLNRRHFEDEAEKLEDEFVAEARKRGLL